MSCLLAGVALKIEAHCDMILSLVRSLNPAYVSAVRCGVGWDTWRRGHRRLADASPSPVAPRPLTEHYTYYLVLVLRWVRDSILELSTNKLRIY